MSAAPPDARRVAAEVLDQVAGGAYANLALGPALGRSGLDERDRHFVTELVYGTIRMARACDWLVDRFLSHAPDGRTRQVLRLGAYQLVFLGTPPHAAVGATVEVAPRRTRGLVNAVLRKVAEAGREWPSDGVRLSYPDWIVETLTADLGASTARDALETMNRAPAVHERADGYIQDEASQWVVDHLAVVPADVVVDVCAAPGGKTTGLAATGATVVAGDVRPARARLVASNVARLDQHVGVVVADAACPPWRPARFDVVLVDAPCTGLGVLRRRPDARWRLDADAPGRLAELQRRALEASAALVRPGGRLAYSVCTLTTAETEDIDTWLATTHPDLEALPAPDAPWEPLGRGARLLPQAADTDGMYLLTLRRPE